MSSANRIQSSLVGFYTAIPNSGLLCGQLGENQLKSEPSKQKKCLDEHAIPIKNFQSN